MSPKVRWCTVYGTIFSLPPPPAPSSALSSSSLIPASLITDSASLTPPPINPESTKSSVGGSVSTRPQPTMKWSLAIQIGTATLLPGDFLSSSRLLASLPAQHKLAVWIIHGCQEMVEQSGSDNSVDLFHAESFRKLAQWKHCGGHIFDGPIADGE